MAEPAIDPPVDLSPLADGFSIDVDFATATVRPTGELDVATAGLLIEAARSLGATDDVTIDCAELTLVSSAGLNALVTISTMQHDRRRSLFLVNVSALTKRRLITGGCASLL